MNATCLCNFCFPKIGSKIQSPPPDCRIFIEESKKRRTEQRLKQIEFGKNTIGYKNFCKLVPKNIQKKILPVPNAYVNYTKRQFDGLMRKWRKELHAWDDPQPIQMLDLIFEDKKERSDSVNS